MLATNAYAAGYSMFSTATGSTGEKPQSKLWYHDGSYWGALRGPDGVAIYEKVGTSWVRGSATDNVLTTGGQADVKWNGSTLYVLVYSSSPKLFEFTYNSAQRIWVRSAGFPVSVPVPSGSETMVLEQDSTGRLWVTAEGNTNVNVYYTLTADHKSWSSAPIILQTGINTDDITSIIAFGGNRVGVFWSDQNRDQFGFRYHNDADPPGTWGGIEIADSGSGHADDHIHLSYDSQGRVYAITKDDNNNMRVHRRGASGGWTTKTNVTGGIGTRGILMVAEEDSKAYILYTRWGVSPETIEYRVADLSTLSFGGTTTFISSSSDMNDVSGMKQLLPKGCLIAVASNTGQCYYNSFGTPPAGGSQPPGAPQNLLATLAADQTRVGLTWSAPGTGTPDGYNVYRQLNGGTAVQLNAGLVAGTSFTDNNPVAGQLCYFVRAERSSLEGNPSNTSCVDVPEVPPGPPQNLTAQRVDPASLPALLSLSFDEGTGQQAVDFSGYGNHGRLGTSTGSDSSDPLWTAGVGGTALQFDGSNDFVEVADGPSLDPTGSFTIEAWVKRTGTSTMGIVAKGDAGARTYRVRIASGGNLEFRWELSTGLKRELIVSSLVTDTAWHHVACVYDQATSQNRVYLDGVLRGTGSASGVPATNAATLLIGSYLSSGSRAGFFKGSIDALRITPLARYTSDFAPPTAILAAGMAAPGTNDEVATSEYVQLAWQAPATGGTVVGYNIYRAVDGGSPAKLNPLPVTGQSYSDTQAVPGQLCYTVRAMNADLVEGAASNEACVDFGPPAPEAPQNVTAILQGSSLDSVLVQWTPATAGTPAVSFNVYRKVGTGSLQQLNASPILGTQFTDAELQSGSHCYQVTGISAELRQGALSAAACVEYTPPAPSPPLLLAAKLVTTPGGPVGGVAAYALDEGSGDTCTDATGHAHTGRLGSGAGTDTADPAWTTGVSGGALLFDGVNDRVLVPDAADLQIPGSFTVEAWIKRGATGVTHCILDKGDSQRRNYCVDLTSTGAIDFLWETTGGTNHGTLSGNVILDANWHHVACVYDQGASRDRIYVDGALVRSAADSGTPLVNTDAVSIGSRLSSGTLKYFFKGAIDQVRISSGAIYDAPFVPATGFAGGPPQSKAQLAWEVPASGTPAGYNVYRQVDGGSFVKINSSLVTGTAYEDLSLPAGALCYQVTAVDGVPQEGAASDPACLQIATARAELAKPESFLPQAPYLTASPNPFNPATTIVFRLPAATRVDLVVYDVRGRRVATLLRELRPAGEHRVPWNGRAEDGGPLASGVYFVALDAGDVHLRQKAVLVK